MMPENETCPSCLHPAHAYGVWSNGECGVPVIVNEGRIMARCACRNDGKSTGYRTP